jgi:hypothetical protein
MACVGEHITIVIIKQIDHGMCWGTHHQRDHHTNARAVEQPARILIESFRHDDENNKNHRRPLLLFH